ncbi:MAG: transglycosylase domain-containing protein [Saprospiraceae bacterium]|uniref:Transglycosylase domain-containing protein n=1 Tax=Candidatus Defluviibacterium haderslevense TaxID=2981993 RepID=A0A9D7S913_9BACT|nr:transglycosylase domain-containing protein [Candidatus Defluviibacterium haderslevense]
MYQQISPEAALAVLAAEDQTFMNHLAFDLRKYRKTLSTIEKT